MTDSETTKRDQILLRVGENLFKIGEFGFSKQLWTVASKTHVWAERRLKLVVNKEYSCDLTGNGVETLDLAMQSFEFEEIDEAVELFIEVINAAKATDQNKAIARAFVGGIERGQNEAKFLNKQSR